MISMENNTAQVFLLRDADRVVALGSRIRQEILARGVKEDRMVIIPNWADGKQICPLERSGNKFVEKRYLADKFIVECSGHMGEGHDFLNHLAGSQALKEIPRPRLPVHWQWTQTRRDSGIQREA